MKAAHKILLGAVFLMPALGMAKAFPFQATFAGSSVETVQQAGESVEGTLSVMDLSGAVATEAGGETASLAHIPSVPTENLGGKLPNFSDEEQKIPHAKLVVPLETLQGYQDAASVLAKEAEREIADETPAQKQERLAPLVAKATKAAQAIYAVFAKEAGLKADVVSVRGRLTGMTFDLFMIGKDEKGKKVYVHVARLVVELQLKDGKVTGYAGALAIFGDEKD